MLMKKDKAMKSINQMIQDPAFTSRQINIGEKGNFQEEYDRYSDCDGQF